jgi:hypothetical protein
MAKGMAAVNDNGLESAHFTEIPADSAASVAE